MRKYLILFILLSCMPLATRGQTIEDIDLSVLPQPTQAKSLRYWFDGDDGNIQTVSGLTGSYSLDVSSLIMGLHTLHYQIVDTEDRVSYVSSAVFLKMGDNKGASMESLRYWFDDDDANAKTSASAGVQTIDASSLLEGLHTVHYQVVGNDGQSYNMGSAIFLKTGNNATASMQSLRYWFDDDATNAKTTKSTGVQTLDASSLLEGIHTVHYQVIGNDGQTYYIGSGVFLKTGDVASGEALKAVKLLYWFDDDTSILQTDITGSAQMIDASMLIEGLHTIHYQALCSDGSITSAKSSIFLRLNNENETVTVQSLRYWFDNEETVIETTVSGGVQLIDASSLIEGLHTVHYQIVDTKGTLGAPYSSVFLKMDAGNASSVAKRIRYWFDDDATSVKIVNVANGTQTLDVSDVRTGLHTLNYQLIDDKGKVGSPYARIFVKNFDKVVTEGDNRIVKYQYWLNTNSKDMQTVELNDVPNPYSLISLLPMQKEPIHSNCFQFEISDGQPIIYAKNAFHIRFHDAAGYFSDEHCTFVDYSVKQEVTDIMPLNRLETNTVDVPGKDEIRWFSFVAEPGDTAAFKVSQAIGIQVFSPDGEEVYSAEGSTSVVYGGCHTWKDGTYYVALHDVTGSKPTVSLDFFHLAKYDVVRQDVTVVGNGGCSTITFEGNGFRDLYAVELYNEQGDSIHHVYIGHESDAQTSVVFDFTDVPLGMYHALFHFTTEDKTYRNNVTVEEAVDIELGTIVSFPSSFLRGTLTTYIIKITNKGNMTAYNVPIYTFIRNQSRKGISYINFEGLNLPGIFDDVDKTLLSQSDIDDLSILAESLGDDAFFNKAWVFDEEMNDSVMVRSNYFFKNIPPNTTATLSLEIIANEKVEVWITIPEEWPSFGNDERSIASSRSYKNPLTTAKDFYCCYIESLNCALDIFSIACDEVAIGAGLAALTLSVTAPEFAPEAFVASLSAGIMGCVTSVSSDGIRSFTESICSSNDKGKFERIKDGLKGALKTTISVNHVLGCISNLLSVYADIIPIQAIKNFLNTAALSISANSIYNDAKIMSSNNFSCKSMLRKKPNCPPNPGGGGGSSSPVPPSDPNDIYGYLSDAGSKFIADHVEKVNYTIEFENDPTFAEASAHTIVIKDTLDSRYFDLKAFMPTSIKIGSREVSIDGADVENKNDKMTFLKTIDMRPSIYAIAQVEGTYSQNTGIAEWRFTSLDPMTMEPTNDLMQGILPVNNDGTSGIGEVLFEIGVKPNKADGTEIPNRASIVFDYEDAILTPTWKNIVDATAPESHVADVQLVNDSTASVTIKASDELSGPWRYDVYVQYGSGAWFLGAENVPVDKAASVKVYDGIDHGFYVVVTDSAGNVEQKPAEREFTLDIFGTLADTDTKVQLAQNWNWMSHNQQATLSVDAVKPKAQRILSQTKELVKDGSYGWVGNLTELLPTQMYKVQMTEADAVQLSGRLFFAQYNTIPLYQGWNWVGYPLPRTLAVSEALALMAAEDGDAIIGLDGISEYRNGSWTGTLTEMTPGQGYMYKSASDKRMKLNAAATMSRRKAPSRALSSTLPKGIIVDKHRYPNVMGVVAKLAGHDRQRTAADLLLVAYCGDECRGVAELVQQTTTDDDCLLMMNVYGNAGDRITFRVVDSETGEEQEVVAADAGCAEPWLPFRSDIVGTLQQPVLFALGEQTGIRTVGNATASRPAAVFDMNGRQLKDTSQKRGVYVVTEKQGTRKVVR